MEMLRIKVRRSESSSVQYKDKKKRIEGNKEPKTLLPHFLIY